MFKLLKVCLIYFNNINIYLFMFKELRKLFWQMLIGKGVKFASQEKFENRIAICRSNKCGEYKQPLKMQFLEKCKACGCFLQSKNRIEEDFISCPKGYWS